MTEEDVYNNMELRCTCSGCPEQYDVYLDEEEVGYLRLRHGIFTISSGGKQLGHAYPEGDGLFESWERDAYLNEAKRLIAKYLVMVKHGSIPSVKINVDMEELR